MMPLFVLEKVKKKVLPRCRGAKGRGSRGRNAERCLCKSLASAARKEIACFKQLSRIDQCCVSVMDCRYWNEKVQYEASFASLEEFLGGAGGRTRWTKLAGNWERVSLRSRTKS